MGGDSYTRVHRGMFRDPRLSAKAKGIFGLLSTHKDGWEVSVESLTTEMRDGRDAIRTGLRELEAHHYLIRAQQRSEGGAFGSGAWFYTDLPAQIRALGITDDAVVAEKVGEAFAEWQNARSGPLTESPSSALTSGNIAPSPHSADSSGLPRSEPLTGSPSAEDPRADQPQADDPPYKERTDQESISRQTAFSICLPDANPGSSGSRVLRSLRLACPVTEQIVRQHHATVTRLLETWPEAELIAHLERETTGDRVANPLGLLVTVIRDTGPYHRAAPSLPPPCGQCDARPDDTPSARMVTDQSGAARPCPRCHPSTLEAVRHD